MEAKVKNWQKPTDKEILQFYPLVKGRCCICGKEIKIKNETVLKRAKYYWNHGNFCLDCVSRTANKKPMKGSELSFYYKLLWKIGKRKKAKKYKTIRAKRSYKYNL